MRRATRGAAWRRALATVAASAATAVLGGAAAQEALAPYTVQVAALSDPEAAIEVSGDLLRDGFPSYVVRAEGAAGAVYRVRVAAFGDRATADRYARALGERVGGAPRPALAEAIPAGILPLAPARMARVPLDATATLLAWGDGVAVRYGADDAVGRYDLPATGASFEAYRAAPVEGGGRVVWATYPLDGTASEGDAPDVREALFRQRLRLLADALGVDPGVMEADAVLGEVGDRRLRVWSRVPPGAERGEVAGVLRRDAPFDARDADAWFGAAPPAPARPVVRMVDGDVSVVTSPADASPTDASPTDASPTDARSLDGVTGDGWRAEADGAWTRLVVGDTTWRALVGAPVEGVRDVLVVRAEGALEVVRLRPR
ncbi:MAG: SPOR domain-containing protein [Trueperaceae bacterium]|nr:SPOR domain-containing protein [Trueperaceae bacterium]